MSRKKGLSIIEIKNKVDANVLDAYNAMLHSTYTDLSPFEEGLLKNGYLKGADLSKNILDHYIKSIIGVLDEVIKENNLNRKTNLMQWQDNVIWLKESLTDES